MSSKIHAAAIAPRPIDIEEIMIRAVGWLYSDELMVLVAVRERLILGRSAIMRVP